jgi:hypothetical protein
MASVDHQRKLARAGGVTALALAGVFVLSIFVGPGNIIHGDPDAGTALAFAASHGVAIKLLGFADGMINTLFGILIVLLIALAGVEGVLARIAYVSAGAAAAIQWTHAGMLYALAELAHRGGADAGVLALFTLGSTMDDADAIVIPIAMACAGWMLLRSRRAPAAVAWLTMAAAGIGTAVSVVVAAGGPDLGPASVISAWIWLLGIGITLLIKPVRGGQPAAVAARAI